ncbi:MAG: hypothetical protein HOO96_41870 [Polyangiaceae bacterium]|nr:hypothetical protein [Polyangiaceae bacterium]
MKKLAWFISGTLLVAAGGIAAVACSSDPVTPLPNVDSGLKKDAGDGGTVDPDGGGGGDSGGDASCFAKLRPSATNGVFCPNLPRDGGADAGRGGNCAPKETCCNGQPKPGADAGFDLTTCTPTGTACDAPTDTTRVVDSYECTENDDCPTAGDKCCIIGFPRDGGANAKPSKGTDRFTCSIFNGEFGTRCKTACDPTNEFQGCQSDADCAGKTCKIVKLGPSDRIEMGVCE